jgi:hypothetical protein
VSADLIARGLANKARIAAAGAARSDNTAQLANAVRNYGFFPQPQSRAGASNIPALALGAAGAASAINGRAAGNPLVLASDSKIKWLSGPCATDGSGAWKPRGAWYNGARNTQYAAIEFMHTGSDFEVCLLGSFFGSSNNVRILVNDRIAGLATVPFNTGSYYYLRATFPASATRRVRIEGANGKFRGINVSSDGEIGATGRNYPLITLMGDSFIEGAGADFYQDGEGVTLARALGGNVMLGGVGGTGVLNPGSNTTWTETTRITDLTMAGVSDALGGSTAPALGIVVMSMNDQGAAQALWSPHGSTFQDAVNNRVWALIDAWTAANPGKPLVFFGPTWPNGEPVLDIYRIRDATQEACWGAASANVWFIDRLGPSNLLRTGANSFTSTTGTTNSGGTAITAIPSTNGIVVGAGVEGAGIPIGATVSAVNSGTQVTLSMPATATGASVALVFRNTHASLYGFGPADGTHPGQAGHNLDALWMARQLRSLILDEFA